MIQQQAVIRRHCREKIPNKQLVRGKFKFRAAQRCRFRFHLTLRFRNHDVVLGVVELFALCNVEREIGVVQCWIQKLQVLSPFVGLGLGRLGLGRF